MQFARSMKRAPDRTVEVLTFIEHESVPILKSRQPGQKALEQKHANTLSKLEGKLPAKTWTWGHQAIKFGHYCGVISLGNLSIEILPKIYGIERDPGSSRHVLIRMLMKARRLKLQRAGSADMALQKQSLLDIFILNFCEQLHAQIMQGMIRRYIERRENLNVLRGRLRIEQQFKHNLAHRERLFCQYDELSEDNLHNQVIKYVLRLLSKAALGVAARKQVNELQMHFDPISDIAVDIVMLEQLSFDRSTARYESIFDQCRWFLEGFHPDVMAGDASCMSLLFNMNQLFETFVASGLRKIAWGRGLRLREQGPQKYMARRVNTDTQLFLMKPDISFLDENNRVVLIADAKWKVLDESEKKLGISQPDLYQIESYAARYQVKELALIYPMQQKLTAPVQMNFQGSGARLTLLPYDVITNDFSGSMLFGAI